MSSNNIRKPVRRLVLDTNPIIKNEPTISSLLSQAETLYTIPSVIDEIRDEVTRSRVQNTLLPFLVLRNPRAASVKFVTEFARKTGDLEVLSKPDVWLMALTYELEIEENGGDWRLRNSPGQREINGKAPVGKEGEEEQEKEVGESIKNEAAIVDAPLPTRSPWGNTIPVVPAAEPKGEGITVGDAAETLEAMHLSEKTVEGPAKSEEPKEEIVQAEIAQPQAAQPEEPKLETPSEIVYQPEDVPAVVGSVPVSSNETPLPTAGEDSISQPAPASDEAPAPEEEVEEDDGDWITPDNLKKHMEKDNGGSTKSKKPDLMPVAIMTSDFAMQNVLLRMNINILSTQLQRVRQLKSWVLRCHACFHVEKNMTKQFCDRCGNPTLLRVPCTTERDGSFRLHLKKNMQWNNRGNVYSIPKPVAGTSNGKLVAGGGKHGWGQSLVLAGDQKEYIQAMTGVKRNKERDLMDEDYLPSILTGDRGHTAGKPKVGAGRNVNSRKRK